MGARRSVVCFGLNGLNRTGQSTAMQLNQERLAVLDGRGVSNNAVVDAGDGVASGERRGRTQRVQTGRLKLDPLRGGLQARARAADQLLLACRDTSTGLVQ